MSLNQSEIQALYQGPVIIRGPRFGIASGYHELPYICLGESIAPGCGTTRVKGRVQVSPRFVVRPQHFEPSYDEIFGEEHTDAGLVGRLFGYLGFRGHPVECSSEQLEVKHLEAGVERVLNETLDEMERMEDITTGVFIAPDAR